MAKVKDPGQIKSDLTPMIDVTFLLLIFFIVTLRFKTLEGQLDASLPKNSGAGESPIIEKLNVRMLVADPAADSRRLRYEVGSQSFASLDQLQTYLAQQDPQLTPVTLDPRDGVIHQDVMELLDLLIHEHFQQISFAGSYAAD
jgi:biopolymer transport protein ExbD